MHRRWFIQTGAGKIHGPISTATLTRAALAGKVRPDTLVRLGSDGEWRPADSISGLCFGRKPEFIEETKRLAHEGTHDERIARDGSRKRRRRGPIAGVATAEATTRHNCFVYYRCPSCERRLRSEAHRRGEAVHCPKCEASFVIPG